MGAASLGQVHLARLAKDHTEVVVKVLRPGIDVLVETRRVDQAISTREIFGLEHLRIQFAPPRWIETIGEESYLVNTISIHIVFSTYQLLTANQYKWEPDMIELKPLKPEAFSAALDKARRYRLLNEPDEAESICHDILESTPYHQEALITLLLSLTDKFPQSGINPAFEQAQEIVPRLDNSYSKSYYLAVIFERRAKFHLKHGGFGTGTLAHHWFIKAMDAFSQALSEDDPKNQEAVLRWNSCARILNSRPDVKAEDTGGAEPLLDTYDTPH